MINSIKFIINVGNNLKIIKWIILNWMNFNILYINVI